MKLLLDMNLAPTWVGFLQGEGFEAVHWSAVGDPRASDAAIMEWARRGGYVVFTHDLDFSALLAATDATGPSVIQVRTQDVLPDAVGSDVVRVLRTHAAALEQGAIVSVDTIEVIGGNLPRRQWRLVEAWAEIHQRELLDDWERLQAGRLPLKIEPLR